MNTATPHIPARWVVIGGGNMGAALVRGMISGRVCTAAQVIVAEPHHAKHAALHALGVGVAASAREACAQIGSGSGILLAVKPQVFAPVAAELKSSCPDTLRNGCLVLSIMAGVTIQTITHATGAGRVLRAMPNLPATVGAGITAIARGPGASSADAEAAERLFAAVGATLWLDEPLMDAFTGLAGSGPAYVFALCEAMAAAGESLGMSPAHAALAARQTVIGAARLLEGSPATPADLRAGVTSKGGTTQAGLELLTNGGFAELVSRAVFAAARRGAELSKGE